MTDEQIGREHEFMEKRMESLRDGQFLNSLVQFALILASLAIMLNIFSTQKKREQKLNAEKLLAEEANKAKSTFLSNMSHDLRTPMNAIVGMTAIASEHIDEKERVAECLRKITLSSKQLLGLINDVLDMSKIESGKFTLTAEPLSLRETMETMCDIIRPQLKTKNQNFNIVIETIISENVLCDSVRINQVLLNFLSNAMKFTPENGSISISLRQEASPKGEKFVRTHFSVKDNGIGMDASFKDKIFTAFEREDNLRIHKIQGTGLGMAITKYIVDAMGGTIDVDTALGKGTTFHVTVDFEKASGLEGDMTLPPEKIADNSTKQADALPEAEKEISLSGIKILLAEDMEINAEIAKTILTESGAEVDVAEDGKIASEKFAASEEGYYNVILMDLRMPNMNGFEATTAIRSMTRADAKTVPIIAMTADAFAEDVQKCLDIGMNAHIAKPIDIDILKKTLVRYV